MRINQRMLICTLLALLSVFVVAKTTTKTAELKSSYSEPLITFSRGISKDQKLPDCMADMACGLMHKRFWFAPLVLRMCRCPDKSECPSDWQENGDEHTMHINLRSQLKFCGQVTKLPTCKPKSSMTALTAKVERRKLVDFQLVTAHCNCPRLRYLDRSNLVVQELGNASSPLTLTTNTYKCKPLIKCQTGDFCGHITANYFETYYVCRCPPDHMCLPKDRKRYPVIEAMYEGLAFRGHCVPNNATMALI